MLYYRNKLFQTVPISCSYEMIEFEFLETRLFF